MRSAASRKTSGAGFERSTWELETSASASKNLSTPATRRFRAMV
jgi:hypothetical protein